MPKLFFGNNDKYDHRVMFIPEASQFGMDINFGLAFHVKYLKKLKGNLTLGYYGKQLNKNEDLSIFNGTSLICIGPSISFFEKTLTSYCNWYRHSIITGNRKLKDYLSNHQDVYVPIELGFRTTLTLRKEIGYLEKEIRFIKNNKLNKFYLTDD